MVQLKREINSANGTPGSLNDGFGILKQDFVSVNVSGDRLFVAFVFKTTALWQIANTAAYSNIKFPSRPEGSTVNSNLNSSPFLLVPAKGTFTYC